MSPSSQPIVSDDRWTSLFSVAGEKSVVQAFRLLRSAGIEPVLIKGWAAARHYPESQNRIYTDIDLAFSASDFDRADRTVREVGIVGLPIDLHRELRHLDTLEWGNLVENSRLVDLDGEEIRVLRDEDHLRVLCVHFLTDGAWYRERLWDIYYAVDRRKSDFDWSRCLDPVAPNRQRWIVCVIGLAHRYLGLSVENLPFASEAKNLPKWFITAVEKQWEIEERLEPLGAVMKEPTRFLRQLIRRIPPEPIYSTVWMEGSFDSPIQIHYQIGSMVMRAIPSIAKFSRRIRTSPREPK